MRALRSFVPVLACACTLITAGPAMAGRHPGPDRACRTSTSARASSRPTAAQRADARGARRRGRAGTQFGTPSSLVRPGGALGATVGGATAPRRRARVAASATAALFRLGSPSPGCALVERREARRRATTHAVTLRQTLGGLDAAGGGLVTDRRREGRRRVEGRLGLLDAERRRDARPAGRASARRPGLAAGRRERRARHVAGARSHAVAPRKAGLGRGLAGPARPPGSRTIQRHAAGRVPDGQPRLRPGVRDASCSTPPAPTPAAYRVFVDARTGAVLARESLVAERRRGRPRRRGAGPRGAGRPPPPVVTPFAGSLPPEDGGCDALQGPVHRRRRRRRPRDRRASPTRTRPRNDIVLKLFKAARPTRSPRPTRSARPSASATRRPAACRPATTSSRSASSATARRRSSRARTPARSASTPARRPRPYLARWRAFPANPPLNPLAPDPWNNPSTDTRAEHVLEAEHDAGGLRPRRRQPRVALAVGLRPAARTPRRTRPSGNNARTAESWTNDALPGAQPVPAGERRRATTRSRGRTSGSPRTATRARPYAARTSWSARASTSRRRSTNLFVHAQPDARLLLPARLHRGELQRAGARTSG